MDLEDFNSFSLKNDSQLDITKRCLPHWELNGSVYFVTFKTWEKLELTAEARKTVLDCCLFFDDSQKKIKLDIIALL